MGPSDNWDSRFSLDTWCVFFFITLKPRVEWYKRL